MKYDLEVLMPVCEKYLHRIDDFKKYGLINVQDNKVLLNLLVSNEEIDKETLNSGWPDGVTANILKKDNPDYVSNLYGYYLDLDVDNIQSRWFMRIDDDTCTDIDGLLSNLDKFYDHELPFYLGDLNDSKCALEGSEGDLFVHYKDLLFEYEKSAMYLKNEIECGIFSSAALVKILKNERSKKLLSFRSGLRGGYGDCAMAFVAALAKVYPHQCHFISHRPSILDFSVMDGRYNHIHMIRKFDEGDNFNSCGSLSYNLLIKAIENKPSAKEKFIAGSKYLQENEDFLQLFIFNSNYSLKLKFERDLWGWYEDDDHILIINNGELIHKLKIKDNGNLVDEDFELKRVSGSENKVF